MKNEKQQAIKAIEKKQRQREVKRWRGKKNQQRWQKALSRIMPQVKPNHPKPQNQDKTT